MKTINRWLLIIHLLVGIGAGAGGTGAILDPYTPMGMSAEALKNSPFTSFLIPGIFLFAVIGLGNLICAVLALRRTASYQVYFSGAIGGILMLWIIIQCIMLMTVHPLHVIFFVIGLIQTGLSFILLYKKNMFPANIAKNIIKLILQK